MSEADLTNADLSTASLCNTLLRGARLESTRVQGARLEGVDLRESPWLLIMELTLQPGVVVKDVLHDLNEARP